MAPEPRPPHSLATAPLPSGARRPYALISDDAVMGVSLATTVVVLALFFSEPTRHWFMIPVWLCGALMLTDAVRWFRGREDLLDPAGVISAFGVHFFFLTPILHVSWNEWLHYVEQPPEWRLGLGLMGIANVLSLIGYRTIANRPLPFPPLPPGATWQPHRLTWSISFGLALACSAVALAELWRRFDGPWGVAEAYNYRLVEDSFIGLGWLFAAAECGSILGFVALFGARKRVPIWRLTAVLGVLAGFLVLRFLTAGLRGSRGNLVWALFWVAGIAHLRLRKFSKRWVLVAVASTLLFLWAYGPFKYGGFSGFADFATEAASQSGATPSLRVVVLGDLGRADVQALLMLRYCCDAQDLPLAYGRTYLSSLALLVPSSLWPSGRPPSKVLEGTRALYGWVPDEGPFSASNLYGVAGEALLNFGPFAIPVVYFLLGLGVYSLRKWRASLPSGDSRELLLPFAVSVLIIILLADSDVVLYYCVTVGLPVIAAVRLGSRLGRVGLTGRGHMGRAPTGPRGVGDRWM